MGEKYMKSRAEPQNYPLQPSVEKQIRTRKRAPPERVSAPHLEPVQPRARRQGVARHALEEQSLNTLKHSSSKLNSV